jgi:hypothetical protein
MTHENLLGFSHNLGTFSNLMSEHTLPLSPKTTLTTMDFTEMDVSLSKSNHSEGTLDDATVLLEFSMSTINTDHAEWLEASQNTFNMSIAGSMDLNRHATERSRFNDSELLGESFAIDETPTIQKRSEHSLPPVLDEENSQDGNEDDDDDEEEERASPQQSRTQEAHR